MSSYVVVGVSFLLLTVCECVFPSTHQIRNGSSEHLRNIESFGGEIFSIATEDIVDFEWLIFWPKQVLWRSAVGEEEMNTMLNEIMVTMFVVPSGDVEERIVDDRK